MSERPVQVQETKTRFGWLVSAPFATPRARLRAIWHFGIKRYDYEICMECGRPVGPHTDSWWSADDVLWQEMTGSEHGVLCPPCFTGICRERGVHIYWKAAIDG